MIIQVRELKLHLMFGFLGIILLFGMAYPAMAQSGSTIDHVVINEADINPAGDDSKTVIEWIELYNPTNKTMDVGGWTIGATSGLKTTYKILDGTKLKSGGFLTYTYGPLWFPDGSSTVQLKNKNGTIVDQTPILRDIENNAKSWQRTIDGFDTDTANDWIFKTSTPGSSNGKTTTTTTESTLSIIVSSDKPNYIFGDLIKISGQVSKKVDIPNQKYKPEQINLVIAGPSKFERKAILFPDIKLMFKTDLKTDKAFKLPEGNYTVSVNYAGTVSTTQFTLGDKAFVAPQKEALPVLYMATDKPSYIPGQTAIISGNMSKVVPLAGVKYTVLDPNKKQVYEGALYPDTNGKFSVPILINNVKPVYGKYDIIATLAHPNPIIATSLKSVIGKTSYQLVEDIKEDKPLSLYIDKNVYGLGDTVLITGRINKVFVPTVEIEIKQPFVKKDVTETFVIDKLLRLKDFGGDGSFKYEFKIPTTTDRLGDYTVKVNAESVDSTTVTFKVVENPDEFIAEESGPLSIKTDKTFYNIGDTLVISGKAAAKVDFGSQNVRISITDEKGNSIISKGDPRAPASKNQDSAYSFTGTPDSSGNFEVKSPIYRNVFAKGTYHIKALYGAHTASTSFVVDDATDLGSGVKILAITDKEIYGVGDEVKLSGKVSTYTAQTSYEITLTDPMGKEINDGVTINNGLFSWSWTVPTFTTAFGTYKLTVSSDSDETTVFFKVSKDPQNETPLLPLVIETDKEVYAAGDTVTISGSAIKQTSGTEGLVINVRPEIVVKLGIKEIYRSMPDLNAGGQFKTSFKIVPAVFKTGEYKVTAKYYKAKYETTFKVDNKFSTGVDAKLALILNTDKTMYLSGDTVKITGKTNKIVFVRDVQIEVSKAGQILSSVTARFDSTGSFSYDYKVSETGNLGTYTVTADTDFDKVTKTFEVVSELPSEKTEEPTAVTQKPTEPTKPAVTPTKITDKKNGITEPSIPIMIGEKTVENKTYSPISFDGLLRVNPGDESDINIKVSLEDGTCIIGPDQDCKVSKSTRSTTSLYQVVDIDGTSYKVRYSGSGAKIEKFTILPEDLKESIPTGEWNVEIIKDNQVSRFYYTISYTSVQ